MRNHHDAAGDGRPRGTFAEGQSDPAHYAQETRIGRFSEGMEALGDDGPEHYVVGSFGDEELAA